MSAKRRTVAALGLVALAWANAALCFALWANTHWLDPFVGILLGAAVPFAGAMLAVSGEKS